MKAPSAENMFCLRWGVVVITIQILRRRDAPSALMILFAGSFGKLVNLQSSDRFFALLCKDEFAPIMFQQAGVSRGDPCTQWLIPGSVVAGESWRNLPIRAKTVLFSQQFAKLRMGSVGFQLHITAQKYA